METTVADVSCGSTGDKGKEWGVDELASENRRLSADNALLRRVMAMRDELLQMVLEGLGIASIADRLAALLGNPVTVSDPYCHVIASSPSVEHGDALRRESIATGAAPREALDDRQVSHYFRTAVDERRPVLFPAIPHQGMDYRRLTAPILAGQDLLGFTTALEMSRPFEDFHATILHHATIVLALELMKRKAAWEAEHRLVSDFLSDLFSGTYSNRSSIVQRAGFLGIDLLRRWLLLLVDADDLDALCRACRVQDPAAARQRLLSVVERVVERQVSDSIVVLQSESIVVLCLAANGSAEPDRKARTVAEMIRSQVRWAFPGVTVSITIGGVCEDIPDFGLRYGEARRALNVCRSLHKPDQTVTLDDLGFYGLLYRQDQPGELSAFAERLLGPIAAYDDRRGTSLLETLEVYLAENGAFRKTAERLKIHLNTLRGRLDRIHRLSNLDLNDSKTRLNLQVALEIRRLI